MPLPDPPAPTPSFAPRGARPKGSQAGWVSTADYPSRDLREGNQGTIRYAREISSTGKVAAGVVLSSAASRGLDHATCRLVSKRARPEPATDGSGAAAAGSYAGTVRWVIPE